MAQYEFIWSEEAAALPVMWQDQIVFTNLGPMHRDRYEFRRFWYPSENLYLVVNYERTR